VPVATTASSPKPRSSTPTENFIIRSVLCKLLLLFFEYNYNKFLLFNPKCDVYKLLLLLLFVVIPFHHPKSFAKGFFLVVVVFSLLYLLFLIIIFICTKIVCNEKVPHDSLKL
jgi:hypothetical protein